MHSVVLISDEDNGFDGLYIDGDLVVEDEFIVPSVILDHLSNISKDGFTIKVHTPPEEDIDRVWEEHNEGFPKHISGWVGVI